MCGTRSVGGGEGFWGGFFGELRVVGEIAEEFFVSGARSDGEDEVPATDETAFPGLADAAEYFFAIAARANRIDAYFEGAKFGK